MVSIAKAEERQQERGDKLYLPGRKNPLLLRADHPVLLLMMRIRDEAHRRAISYHRRLRKAALTKSQLDLIPGVGGARKRRLLRYFDDADAVSGASVEELTRVSGISRALAETIFNFFRDTRESLPQGKRNGEY